MSWMKVLSGMRFTKEEEPISTEFLLIIMLFNTSFTSPKNLKTMKFINMKKYIQNKS